MRSTNVWDQQSSLLRGHCTVKIPIEIHALRPLNKELLLNSCNCWGNLNCLMMKQHNLYLIYLVLNIDRQSQFFTNLTFLTKPVFFKLFPHQYLVLGALHCGNAMEQKSSQLFRTFGQQDLRSFYLTFANGAIHTF